MKLLLLELVTNPFLIFTDDLPFYQIAVPVLVNQLEPIFIVCRKEAQKIKLAGSSQLLYNLALGCRIRYL